MAAKIDVAVTKELNAVQKKIDQQDKELLTLHEQVKKGCTQKTADLEAQVKTLQDFAAATKALMAANHTALMAHEQTLMQLQKK